MKFKNKVEFKIFITFFIIFSYFAQWNDIWDFNVFFALTKAIVEENRFEIDSYSTTTELIFQYGGHYYSQTRYGISFFMTWFYAIIRLFTMSSSTHEFLIVVFSNSLFSAISCVIIYRVSKFFTKDNKHRLFTALTYGLATSIFPYSLGFYVYIFAIFFILLAFYIIIRKKPKSDTNHKKIFLAGVFSGLAYVAYPVSLLPIFLLFLYGLMNYKKKILWFVIGGMIGSLPLFFYWYVVFGTSPIFTTTYMIFSIFKSLVLEFNLNYSARSASDWFSPKVSFLKILPRTLFYPWNGLFFYYPVLFMAFIGILVMCWEKKLIGIFILVLFLFVWIFQTVLLSSWWGEFSFGPRRFILVTPFLVLGLPTILKKINKLIFLVFFVLSSFTNLLGLQMWTSLDAIPGIDKIYVNAIENFRPIRNPLLEDYLPSFIKNGPRSLLFENLIFNRKISIRFMEDPNPASALIIGSKPFELPKIKLISIPPFYVVWLRTPFLCLIPLLLIMFFIWYEEIYENLIKHFLDKKKCFIMTAIILLLFFLLFIKITPMNTG